MATSVLALTTLLSAFTLILAYFGLFLKRSRRVRRNYPPGPPRLPVLGNVHQLAGTQPYLKLTKWAAEFGKIYSVKLGLDDAVVVSDPKLIKQLLGETAASGRIQNAVFMAMSMGENHGILNTEGGVWEEQRRFALRKLRDGGFAKSSMEGMILDEAEGLMTWFKRTSGTPVQCDRIFNSAVVNSLWNLVSGERSEVILAGEKGVVQKSEILGRSDELMGALRTSVETGLMFAPFLRHIAPGLTGWTQLMSAVTGLHRLGAESVKKHLGSLNTSSPRDLIDHYLVEIGRTKDPKSSFYLKEGEKNLRATIVDLFEAGSETASTTLSWAFLYLAHYPTVQNKLTEEIRSLLGDTQAPSLGDKRSLPYTEAVIMEVLRTSALVPMGVLHRMLWDFEFHGFHLPKDTIIVPNLYACLHDSEIWGDPENFRPERFLTEDGSKLRSKNFEAFIPFSAGRRICLGESLARDTLFLFMTSIFQKFQLFPGDDEKPDFKPQPGFINIPKPFKVILREHVHTS